MANNIRVYFHVTRHYLIVAIDAQYRRCYPPDVTDKWDELKDAN